MNRLSIFLCVFLVVATMTIQLNFIKMAEHLDAIDLKLSIALSELDK